jgi:hypothetical protein
MLIYSTPYILDACPFAALRSSSRDLQQVERKDISIYPQENSELYTAIFACVREDSWMGIPKTLTKFLGIIYITAKVKYRARNSELALVFSLE